MRFIERKGKTDLVCIDMLSVKEAVFRLVNIQTGKGPVNIKMRWSHSMRVFLNETE